MSCGFASVLRSSAPCRCFLGAGLAVSHLAVLQRRGRSRLHGGGAGGDRRPAGGPAGVLLLRPGRSVEGELSHEGCRGCSSQDLAHALLSGSAQGLLEMEFALPTDSSEASGLSLLRRLWVARFDVEEEGRSLADK